MPKESSPGFVRVPLITIPLAAAKIQGTSQIIYLEGFNPGFKCVVEKVTFTQTTALAGVGGSQTINVRKGASDGTVIATLALVVADTGLGETVEASVAAADEDTAWLGDSDTISAEMAASGTAFTGGDGFLTIWGRQRPQAAR